MWSTQPSSSFQESLLGDNFPEYVWSQRRFRDSHLRCGMLGFLRIVSISISFVALHFIPWGSSEDAVESGDLATFLRLNESWEAAEDETTSPVKPVGVPGAVAPLQMTPDHIKKKILAQPPESPLREKKVPVNKQGDTFDVSTELEGYGLQGVHVTDEELRNLVAELGLEGDEAGELVKGLSGPSSVESKAVAQSEPPQNNEQEHESEETVGKDDTI